MCASKHANVWNLTCPNVCTRQNKISFTTTGSQYQKQILVLPNTIVGYTSLTFYMVCGLVANLVLCHITHTRLWWRWWWEENKCQQVTNTSGAATWIQPIIPEKKQKIILNLSSDVNVHIHVAFVDDTRRPRQTSSLLVHLKLRNIHTQNSGNISFVDKKWAIQHIHKPIHS